ncbi:MAG: MMPL family transporter [Actinobacteria bacterium]|nr:MMPL family transporter [Actinomycetota bacterium]
MTPSGTTPPPDATAAPTPRSEDHSLWARVGRLVVDHPVRVLLVSLAIVLTPLLALPSMRLTHDTLADLPGDAPSVSGFDALAGHFPPGETAPLTLVIDDDEPVTDPASLRAMADLSRNLKRLDGVGTVRSVAMPTDGEVPDVEEAEEVGARIADFQERLEEAAAGAGQLADGAGRIEDGLATIEARLPELAAGLDDAEAGVGELRAGVDRLRTGVDQLAGGLRELRAGLVEARDGAARLRTDVAEPAEEAIREAWDALSEFTVGRTDPEYERAARATGEAYGRITGEDPRTGQQVREGYEGLAAALRELEVGLGEAVTGAGELADGAGRLDEGLAQLDAALAQLEAGLAEAGPGVDELRDGVARLRDGAGRLEAGAGELRRGLASGAARLEDSGFEQLVPGLGEDSGPFVVTPGLLEALPEVREQLGFFLADDDTRTRVFVGMSISPFSPAALDVVDRVTEVAELSLNGSPLEDATVAPTGISSFFHDVDAAADRDFRLIIVAVIIGVFLVLVVLLRAIVAPLYMVVTVLLSFGAALGIATVVFQMIGGRAGLAWWIPPFLYVLLVALGADYNIYLMSRVREEAERRTTRAAVAEATRLTGGVITSAGLILAGSFAALMSADLASLRQMGFATTVGILLDTFVVRTFLVPSIAVLLGRFNWWPSARSLRA